MKRAELFDLLDEDGWKHYNYSFDKVLFFKSFPNHSECKCNEGKLKQVEIYFDTNHLEFEVECVGQLEDGTWTNIRIYAIKDPSYIFLMEKVKNALSLWDKIASENIKK
jgi:hypothetical protein